ncbi:MAG: glycosyltransferase family 9 protein, partial [Ignavibacteriaceae bacterium]|nr:glycosyltransferase family 9 protein [Ignavibacteriaceae bacterium]
MKKLEIFFKNIILNLLLILSRGRISSGKTVFGSNSNVLFIRLNRIGDALVTTPLLTQVKKQTGCKIYVMADKKNYFIFEHCPAVERTFIYNKGLVGLKEMKRLLKNKKIDSIVDLHDDVSLTVSLFLWYVKCQQVFGLKKRNENLYTHTVSRLESTKYHIVERTLELAKLFGLKPDFQNAFINYKFNTVSKKLAEQYLNTLNSKFLLGINITAGSKARFWGKSNFIKLIEEIRRFDINYVVFTTTDYFEQAKKI